MKPVVQKSLIFLLAVAVLTGAGIWWRYSGSQGGLAVKAGAPANAADGGAPQGIPVKVASVTTGTLKEEVAAVGTLLANESVIIRPELDGRIDAIHFEEGQPVAKGAKLVSMDYAESAAQVAAAEAETTLNRQRLERAQELQKKNFISEQALDEARENLNASRARLAERKARLDKMIIRAPFDGIVGVRQVSPGAYVNKGQDIARLEGIGTLKVDFRVPEIYLRRIAEGQKVGVMVDGYPGERFDGAIYAIEPAVDEQTRTVLLRAKIPNPGVRLKPGMFARITLTLGERPNAMLVPEQAIVPRNDANYVFKVADGKAMLTKVDLGLRQPGQVQVVSGLEAGDQVVTDGQLKLRDGAPVAVIGRPPAAASAGTKG
ncbi:MAG: efflux RND transporter periplasmic adaptor subunit [Pseudomonadota bacterium]